MSTLDDHLQSLYRLRRFGIKLGLESITRLMRGLGDPQDAYPCIHIAGTNGKGSVAAILASILTQAGFRIGLYTSPHLVRFNERIQVNGNPASDHAIIEAAHAAMKVYAQGDPPTFFECATAMALYHFANVGVDWAVVETGMGGRYDATNIIHPQACVITNVSLEHTEYLGNRLDKIAYEKAGIIKAGAGVVTGIVQKKPLAVVAEVAAEKSVPLLRLGKDMRIRRGRGNRFTYFGTHHRWADLEVGLSGSHQKKNAALALGTLELLIQNGLEVSKKTIKSGLLKVHWPGRLELVATSPVVVLDGAHNPSAIRNLKQYLKGGGGQKKWILVVGILADKGWKAMLSDLSDTAARIILTKPDYERAEDPEKLASILQAISSCPITVVPNVADAVSLAMHQAGPDDAVCVTGSLYTVGEAKAYFEGLDRGTQENIEYRTRNIES